LARDSAGSAQRIPFAMMANDALNDFVLMIRSRYGALLIGTAEASRGLARSLGLARFELVSYS